ncbi:MAG: hypothetical protein IPN51_13230 [Chloracidobacterium sp.]|nr:hypothetical protein [Chloracidobacterium sp.]
MWHSLDSFTGGYSPVQFGNSTDKIAPADFDGDGQTDRTVFRDGTWYIFQSSNNQPRVFQWGSAGDLPRQEILTATGRLILQCFGHQTELGTSIIVTRSNPATSRTILSNLSNNISL